MQIYNSIQAWLAVRHELPTHLSLGFVPTMGNLHQGHLSLVANSQVENDKTVVSLFINPTQFNQRDDFEHYPRTLDDDLNKLREQGVDFCLIPNESMMYPDQYNYHLQETKLATRMEGKHRPGHFNGVLTVVMKLFNLVKPHRAYFGEKDYQQLALIRGMVSAFFLEIDIKSCPTVREPSQLALSSRNSRLSLEEKILADTFATRFHQKEVRCEDIRDQLEALGIQVDYIEEQLNRRFAAVKIGEVRLIDNYAI